MNEGIEASVRWPLSSDQRAHVVRLGELIHRAGTARFMQAHLVRADERDFPDPWEPTLASLYRLLYRLYWHAYLDVEVAIEDARGPASPNPGMLLSSSIDLLEARDGRVTYRVAAFGNDDIAGLISHSIGEAFLRLSPAAPFRGGAATPTETDASIAACYLGLGVLVANASMYRRYRSRLAGRQVVSENSIETTGGLSIADATLLLAIQLVVRDDMPDAVATLHGPQKDWVDRWIEVLDPHEDELRELLALDDAADVPLLERAGEPREAPAIAEPAPPKYNVGRVSFRILVRRSRLLAGTGIGFAGAVVGALVVGPGLFNAVLLLIAPLVGVLVRRSSFKCAACGTVMETELDVCPTCGVTLPETLRTRAQQAARRAEFAEQAEAEDPELAEEAVRAYHPDA
jgi:hypothetical protein